MKAIRRHRKETICLKMEVYCIAKAWLSDRPMLYSIEIGHNYKPEIYNPSIHKHPKLTGGMLGLVRTYEFWDSGEQKWGRMPTVPTDRIGWMLIPNQIAKTVPTITRREEIKYNPFSKPTITASVKYTLPKGTIGININLYYSGDYPIDQNKIIKSSIP